jgi:TfoX/Sxy family transcriptional regulator of competence genes
MASRQSTVDYVLEQIAGAGNVSARKMFGEYGIYCDGRMVALVCDDLFYVKPTEAGRNFAAGCEEAAPYVGAKPCLLISEDRLEDPDWVGELVRLTTREIPLPKPKASKAKAPSKSSR